MRDQTNPNMPRQYLELTCPTCKRRVRILREDPLKLPTFFPFCSERCKLIDLGAWFGAHYRILSKPDDQADSPAEEAPSPGSTDSHP